METGWPTGVRLPVSGSMRNTATLLPGMLAQSSNSPPGVIARFCGPLPRLGTIASKVSRPSSPMR